MSAEKVIGETFCDGCAKRADVVQKQYPDAIEAVCANCGHVHARAVIGRADFARAALAAAATPQEQTP